MGTYTEYKQLEKPLSTDKYNISVANKNNDVIDSELHKLDLKNESQDQLLATKEALNDEISRAQAKENEISADLDNETLRAMASEEDLSNDILSETNRAVMAEETITEDLSNHNTSASAHSDIRDLISGLTVSGSVTLTNNLLATIAGTALDATQGKALNDKGEQMAFYQNEEDGMWHFRDWNGADTVIPFNQSGFGNVYFALGSTVDFTPIIEKIGKEVTDFTINNFNAVLSNTSQSRGRLSASTINGSSGFKGSGTSNATISKSYNNGLVTITAPAISITNSGEIGNSGRQARASLSGGTILGIVFDPSDTPFTSKIHELIL